MELESRSWQTGDMNTAELRMGYRPEDEWHGQLNAIVSSGGFSGEGSAWFDRQRLKETFVAALRIFPLSASGPPMIEGGFWSKERQGTLEQCHLRVAVRPYDARGTLMVQVDLATECSTTPDNDLQQTVTTRFLTNYTALQKFASDLEQVLDGERTFAALPATVI